MRKTQMAQQMTAIEHGESVLRSIGSRVPAARLEAVIDIVERVFDTTDVEAEVEAPARGDEAVSSHTRDLVARLTGGRRYSETERAELELSNLQRGFQQRREWLGGALNVDAVRQLLGCKTRQTVHDRLKAGKLLGVMEDGAWVFPLWQFDPSGPSGVVEGLPLVLKALGQYAKVSQLQKVAFLRSDSPYFGGDTPLQAMKKGRLEDVIALARTVGVH